MGAGARAVEQTSGDGAVKRRRDNGPISRLASPVNADAAARPMYFRSQWPRDRASGDAGR